LRIWDSLFCTGRDVLLQVFLCIVRERAGAIHKAKTSTEVYELMKTIPPSIIAPSPLFAEACKHFFHLYQIQKMRVQSQKAISDAINKREEQRLQTQTHFTIQELDELKKAFAKFSSLNKLTKDNFDKFIRAKFGKDSLFMDNIFKVFDTSKDGVVDFREFCIGLSVYAKGTLEERLAFCFSLFDINQDGFVQPNELLLILQAQYKSMFPDEEPDYVNKFVEYANTFDINKDGKFSLEEFKEVVNRQPLIVQFLNLVKFSEGSGPVAYAFKEVKVEEVKGKKGKKGGKGEKGEKGEEGEEAELGESDDSVKSS